MKFAKMLLVLVGAISIFTGCSNDDENTALRNDNNNKNNDNGINIENVGYKSDKKSTPNLDVADKAANKIKNMKEIKRAIVLKTDQNAYVAVELEGNKQEKVTKDIEDKVAKAVKDEDKDINDVLVSSNPDFFSRMDDYQQDIKNGDPIKGIFDEFSQTIQRVFPNDHSF